ncbi:PepSY domain-containing protein [Microbacterium sp. NPDC057407]|uniref:PepSY domain-containing protein n=1 Tax=Microbacterium sp. NPDC057407 TaxID=3346120 RepID=UPI00366EED60
MTDPNSKHPDNDRTQPVPDAAARTDATTGTDGATVTTNTADGSGRKLSPRRRTLVTAVVATVGAIALVGGGVAAGTAIADEVGDDDDRTSAQTQADDDGTADDSRDDDGTDDRGSDDTGTDDDDSSAGDVRGTTSADELIGAIDAAAEASDGEATSIEAEAGGAWDVTFHAADGAETEVRVDGDGTASVVSEEGADDSAPEGALDGATVDALVAAALADTDGTILELSLDDDSTAIYEVVLRDADGSVIELTLDADFAVVGFDVD